MPLKSVTTGGVKHLARSNGHLVSDCDCCSGGGEYGNPCSNVAAPATWSVVLSGTYDWIGWGCPPQPPCAGSVNGVYYNVTDYGGAVTLYQCPTNPCVWDSYQGGCGTGTNNEYHTIGNVQFQTCTSGSFDTGTSHPLRYILTIVYNNMDRFAKLHVAVQEKSVSIPYPEQYAQLLWDGTGGLPVGLTEFNQPITFSSVNCFTGYPFHVGGSATVTPNL